MADRLNRTHHQQLQRRTADVVEQPLDRWSIEYQPAIRQALGAGQHVLVDFTIDRIEANAIDADLRQDVLASKVIDFIPAHRIVGNQCNGHQACHGLGAVFRVGAHFGSPWLWAADISQPRANYALGNE